MPLESLITFSPGQRSETDVNAITTRTENAAVEVITEKPILDYRVDAPTHADLPLPSTPTFAQTHLSELTTGFLGSAVPRGVTERPRLNIVLDKREPLLTTRQLWEGTITEVRNGGFLAVLSDKSNPSNPDEQARFDFDNTEISPDDLPLVRPGASFYWTIGNQMTVGGQSTNVSFVQFRRVPAWTERRLAQVTETARSLRQLFAEK